MCLISEVHKYRAVLILIQDVPMREALKYIYLQLFRGVFEEAGEDSLTAESLQ